MICPYCNHQETSVLDSRGLDESVSIKRRRECKKCEKRFTTLEKVMNVDLKVVKKDGRLEAFERDKVAKGVRKSCWKRGVSEEQIERLVDDIEMRLLNRKEIEIPSGDIGKLILTRLKKLDDVAYLRFASVYLEMESATDFRDLCDQLQVKKKKNG